MAAGAVDHSRVVELGHAGACPVVGPELAAVNSGVAGRALGGGRTRAPVAAVVTALAEGVEVWSDRVDVQTVGPADAVSADQLPLAYGVTGGTLVDVGAALAEVVVAGDLDALAATLVDVPSDAGAGAVQEVELPGGRAGEALGLQSARAGSAGDVAGQAVIAAQVVV